MELDVGDLFGDREAASVGGSDGESDRGSDAEEQQRNVWGDDTEGQGAPGEEEATEAPAPQPIKAKKVVANPQPKLDAHRLAGPRGMFALNKICRNFKFKGKGREREDLQELLRVLEHWAHRLYPKLPFKDTLEQIEKLGTKKNVQVNIKKLRLDMFIEGGEEGEEDNVRRGPDEDSSETTPVVDVFDELLGITPSAQPATTTTTTTTMTSPVQTVLPPASPPPKPATQLTQEQRERMERNKKLAIEKRLARLQQQQQQDQDKEESSTLQEMTSSQELDYFDKLPGTGRSLSTSEDRREKPIDTEELMDGAADKMENSQGRRETQETQDEAELMDDVADKLEDPQERRERQDTLNKTEELMDGATDKMEDPQKGRETQKTLNEAEELMDGATDKMEDPKERRETQETLNEAELMDGATDKMEDPQERSKMQGTLDDTEFMDGVGEKSESPNARRHEQEGLSDTEEPMDVILNKFEDSKERSEAQRQDTENMNGITDKLKDLEERRKTQGGSHDTGEMDIILDKLQS